MATDGIEKRYEDLLEHFGYFTEVALATAETKGLKKGTEMRLRNIANRMLNVFLDHFGSRDVLDLDDRLFRIKRIVNERRDR